MTPRLWIVALLVAAVWTGVGHQRAACWASERALWGPPCQPTRTVRALLNYAKALWAEGDRSGAQVVLRGVAP